GWRREGADYVQGCSGQGVGGEAWEGEGPEGSATDTGAGNKTGVNTVKDSHAREKSNPQLPPPLPAKSKIREPLRFFPNGNAINEKRKLGAGLKISVNELGVRRVSQDIKGISLAREKWVPKVTAVQHKEVGQPINKAQEEMELVGLYERGPSTYEIGEGSGVYKDGPCDGSDDLGSDLNQSQHPLDQANSLNWVAFQPDKVRPAQANLSVSCDVALTSEKMMRLEYSCGAIAKGVTWFI
ncbi:hypothetical protein FCV25MIE_14204, partial [Fagus crenata]